MKWKNPEDAGGHEKEEGTEFFEEAYSPLKSRKYFLGFDWFSLIGKPVFWFAAGVVILAVLMIVIFPGGSRDLRQTDEFEKRFALLEKRLELLDQFGSRLEALEKDKDGAQPLLERVERLEASIAPKLTEMSEKISQMEKQITATAVKQDAKVTAPAQPAGKYHVVKKGETLYSISRQYGLSVEQLTQLNNLRSGSPIQPGQRLSLK